MWKERKLAKKIEKLMAQCRCDLFANAIEFENLNKSFNIFDELKLVSFFAISF